MEAARTQSQLFGESDQVNPEALVIAQAVLKKIHGEMGEVRGRLSERRCRLQRLEEKLTPAVAYGKAENAGGELERDLAAADQESDQCVARLGVLEVKLVHREREIDELKRTVAEVSSERDASNARYAEQESRGVASLKRGLVRQAELELQLKEAKRQLGESEDQVLLLWNELMEWEQSGAQGTQLKYALEEMRRALAAPPSVTGESLAELEPEDDFLCFVGDSEGYRLATRTGSPPDVGDSVHLDGKDRVTTKVASSPFPSDPRRCVYLEAVS
jgi:hypothetical protein